MHTSNNKEISFVNCMICKCSPPNVVHILPLRSLFLKNIFDTYFIHPNKDIFVKENIFIYLTMDLPPHIYIGLVKFTIRVAKYIEI